MKVNEISFPTVWIVLVKNHSAALELEMNVHVQTRRYTYTNTRTCSHMYGLPNQWNNFKWTLKLLNHRQDIFQRNTSSHTILFTILELIIHS